MRLFRHRKTIRKAINTLNTTSSFTNTGAPLGTGLGAVRASAGTPSAGMIVDKSVDKFLVNEVVITPYYPHNGDMSGEEVKMNKSHRVAMAQALLAELSEATARYGAGNKGVERLHRMVRAMVAELLA
jgi:hypothetical protein